MDPEKRGLGLEDSARKTAERMIAQANALERRLTLTEHAVALLTHTLDEDLALADAVNQTYEAHSFNHLQLFLLREVVSGLCAGVLDTHKDAGSVRRLLAELRREEGSARDALRSYHSDCTGLTISFFGSPDLEDKEGAIERHQRRHRARAEREFDELWPRIDRGGSILTGTKAKRMLLARNKLIAHYEPGPNGLIDFDSLEGLEGFSCGEPIEFFNDVRPYVYEFYLLVTSTTWDDRSLDITDFYARGFWERFKSGSNDLERPNWFSD